MPERRRRLQETLERLHAELESTERVDEATRDELRAAARAIEDRLEAEGDREEGSLAERVRALALRFEESHPKLAETLNRLVHGLAELGI